MVVRRGEPTLCQLICNAQGYTDSCSMRFTAKFEDRRWIVREAALQHSHSCTVDEQEAAWNKTAAAIEKLEEELQEQKRARSQVEKLPPGAVAGGDDYSGGNAQAQRPLETSSTSQSFPNAMAVAGEIAELTSGRVRLLLWTRMACSS
jgi:hypothetical protein